MVPFTPEYPHQIQSTSGKHPGEYLERLMFTDYNYLDWFLKFLNSQMKPDSVPNNFHNHLIRLINQGENRIAQKMCPQCGLKPIAYFSIRGYEKEGYSMSIFYTCCNDDVCQNKLKNQSEKSVLLLKATFSNSLYFKYKSDTNRWIAMLKEIHILNGRITSQRAFEFFKRNQAKPP